MKQQLALVLADEDGLVFISVLTRPFCLSSGKTEDFFLVNPVNPVDPVGKSFGLDRIYRIFRIFSRFPDETEKGFIH